MQVKVLSELISVYQQTDGICLLSVLTISFVTLISGNVCEVTDNSIVYQINHLNKKAELDHSIFISYSEDCHLCIRVP